MGNYRSAYPPTPRTFPNVTKTSVTNVVYSIWIRKKKSKSRCSLFPNSLLDLHLCPDVIPIALFRGSDRQEVQHTIRYCGLDLTSDHTILVSVITGRKSMPRLPPRPPQPAAAVAPGWEEAAVAHRQTPGPGPQPDPRSAAKR